MRIERGPIAVRIEGLLRRRAVRNVLLGSVACGLASPLLPLADVPGWESAAVANLLVALVGGVVGVASARQERAIERGEVAWAERSPAAFTAAARAIFAAFALASLPIVAVAVAALIAGAIGAPCSLGAGLAWYPILPLPSAFLAASLGVAAGAASERRRVPGILYAIALGAGALATAWPVLTGPQVFLFDHLLGWLPGPIYDEVVQIRAPLILFRLLTVAWGAFVLGAVALLWEGGRLRRPKLRPVAATVVLAAFTLGLLGHLNRSELGFGQSTESVKRALGGETEGERCVVIHPREMKRERVARFVAECDFRVGELESFFGARGEKPTVFLYRSTEEKRRLVGAAGTQFAKPWLGQLHVDDRGFPHPVLKHELAHLVAGALGRKPFGVTAVAFGLLPVQGLVEGAAVAADWPSGELTVHEQARAMRLLGLAPSLPKILSALGFYGQPASRAYTYAGSFVRWLVETRGADRFARVYKDGDFAAAYGQPLESLVGQWEAWLDRDDLPERARAVAERRFKRTAIFGRPCAREVADLASEARDAATAGDAQRAIELYEKCSRLDQNDPAFLAAQASVLARSGDAQGVSNLAERIAAHPNADVLAKASALTSVGDAWAKDGDRDRAAAAWEEARAFPLDRASERALLVKAEAVADPEIAGVVLPYLAEANDARLFALRDLLGRRPSYATGWYLIGRRLQQRDEPEAALAHLDRALAGGLSPLIEREARRTRALALLDFGRPADAAAELERLADEGDAGERLETADLLDFSRFQMAR